MGKQPNQDMNFEDSIKQLDKIASELESGKLNLEDSIKMFEEGMNLSKKCNEFLEDAEKKITVLVSDNGNMQEKDFVAQED